MEIVSLSEAKALSQNWYFTGKPCVYGHLAKRKISRPFRFRCVACLEVTKARQTKRYVENREKIKDYQRKYRAKNLTQKKKYYVENREKINNVNKRYRAENREKIKTHQKKYRAENREKIKTHKKKYSTENREKINATTRKYRAENREKINARDKRSRNTSLVRFHIQCERVAKRVLLGAVTGSRLSLLDYGTQEFEDRLISTLPPGMSITEARATGYHLDHIIPLAFIHKVLSDQNDLTFRVAMDLKNQRMIPGKDNMIKSAKMEFDPIQERVFHYLCEKYDIYPEMVSEALCF